ncbi:MAG TPA: SufS family cysteine desulfurase [Thermoproteota archaeon]|nr:SufS family cysteine desulfurase [Thermoproteota archaeon]
MTGFDAHVLRKDFPIFEREIVGGKRMIYLDSAGTSQKPKRVVEAIEDFYLRHNANVLRSANTISSEASELYVGSRRKVASFIGADEDEVVFTTGTTDSLNILAKALSEKHVGKGEKVVTSILEHHSNLLPWRIEVGKQGGELVVVRADKNWRVSLDGIEQELEKGAKIVTVTHVSNVLGTVNDIGTIARKAHDHGAVVVIDSAQGVPHLPVNVHELGIDFLAFSGHKMLGPTGIGVLYGKRELLDSLAPWQFGGGMVKSVTMENETLEDPPSRYEAGTPNIAGAIGLGAAVDYLKSVGMTALKRHEEELVRYALDLLGMEDVEVYGPREPEALCGIVSFNLKGVHPHDVSAFLDQDGIMIRAGHHCAQPLVNSLGVSAVARASFYLYNTTEDLDALAKSVNKAREVLA